MHNMLLHLYIHRYSKHFAIVGGMHSIQVMMHPPPPPPLYTSVWVSITKYTGLNIASPEKMHQHEYFIPIFPEKPLNAIGG